MSGRARNRAPRSSTSSPTSVASSSTVDSRLVRKSLEVGGPVGIAGRKQSPGKLAGLAPSVQNDDSYLQAKGYLDGSPAKTHHMRQHRQRKSGGFLLQPAFNAKQSLPAETYKPEHNHKGKGPADDRPLIGRQSTAEGSSQRSTNGLDAGSSITQETNRSRHSRNNTEGEHDFGSAHGAAVVDDMGEAKLEENNNHGLQGMRKLRGSADKGRYGAQAASPRQLGMDPAEIVNMALNLSESRRRHLSAGRLASMPISSGRRVASAGLQQPNLALQGSYRANESGNLLQQHLQRQINSSRGVSPANSRPYSQISTSSDTSNPRDRDSESPVAFDQPIGYGFQFSAGTIARAEKARKAIELSIEFRRLLQFLPPLQPDSSAPDNNLVTTTSHPGSAHVDISRSPTSNDQQRPLGRAYNPLQVIRNRKLRARERKQLDHDIDMWDSVDTAKCWVDAVEEHAGRPDYRCEDCVALPSFDSEAQNKPPGEQHNGPFTKPKRSRLDWTISPCEAFADAYWLEQGDNKASVENRHGQKIFPGYRSPALRHALTETESIHDLRHRHGDHAEPRSVASSITSPEDRENARGRPHKKRNFLHLPINDSHGKFKRRSWHRSPSRSSTSSNLSNSEHEDGQGQIKPTIKVSTKDEETGPLRKHIDTLLKSADVGPPSVSPISPDHWDNQHSRRPITNRFDNNLDSSTTGDSASPQDHRHWPTSKFLDFTKKPKRDIKEEAAGPPRSSLDTLDSTAPNSPNPIKFVPSISVDLSPPPTAGDSSTNKHKLPKFHFFRHSDEKSKNNIESNDFAFQDHDKGTARFSIDEAQRPNRSSLDVPRPKRLRHVRSRTTDENSSLKSSKDRISEKDWSEIKEPSSAVGRFFKGGRIGDLVRGEGSRFSDRMRRKDASADEPGATEGSVSPYEGSIYTSGEEDGAPRRELKPKPYPTFDESSITDDDDRIGRQQSRPRYHMTNLPSFRHSSMLEKKNGVDAIQIPGEDPVSSQERALKELSRSQRVNKLAPPRIDLSSISRSSSPDLLRTETNTREPDKTRLHERKSSFGSSTSRSRSFAEDGGLSKAMGATGLAELPVAGPDKSRSPSRSRPDLGTRHWSISNKPQEAQAIVNHREIARIEALFLSSGIKAKEITERALTSRPERPDFLVKAAKFANTPLYPVARKEEHVLAARILSTHLEKTTRDIEGGMQRFRESGVQNLRAELHEVRMRIADELTPLVLSKADEADAFTGELTSRHTLDIKQLNDYIELMKRQRWRRLRWVRRMGFTLLEWMLLSFMWWVWLIVIVIKSVRAVVVGVVNGIRWILWL
ncbi:MAG: hypothetical protein M1822_000845 [Bathelium mastoideum]|nr:MAG: hypothetical protein M1822_000845 [Bathelium mastoideum]